VGRGRRRVSNRWLISYRWKLLEQLPILTLLSLLIYICVLKDMRFMQINMRLISIFSIVFFLVKEIVLGEREQSLNRR